MQRLALMLVLLILPALLFAQGTESKEFGIKFKGFVKTDFMLDSRQTVAVREGHFLLYPAAEALDENGEDLNAAPHLNMLAIQTRLTGVISAPDAFGARVSGLIEGAFFGHSDGDINGFRLRHAYAKLDWADCSLLVGQYWHPLFITEVFPDVVSFNTGVPFQPFSRNPQIRYMRKLGDFEMTLTAASQRDFTSTGPGGASSVYLRNALLPMLNFNLKAKTKNWLVGAGVDYKTLLPRLSTTGSNDKSYKSEEKISSLTMMGFAKMTAGNLTVKAEGIYGQNLTDLLMLGGYAVKSTDAATGIEQYTNLNTVAGWGEVVMKAPDSPMTFALFGGYTKTLGADDPITGAIHARGSNIDAVLRAAPRVEYQQGKVRFAAEAEYTSAGYGVTLKDGSVANAKSVSNLRLLLAAYLFF